MTKDEHGIDLAEDTDLDVEERDDPDEETAERVRREEADDEEDSGADKRERAVEEAENPDAHRDGEPFVSG